MAEIDLALLSGAPEGARSAATRALVFPGQGSQCVGMGRELAATFPVARDVFDEVDNALDTHLSRLMAAGPEEELILTENAQPALMAVGIAYFLAKAHRAEAINGFRSPRGGALTH